MLKFKIKKIGYMVLMLSLYMTTTAFATTPKIVSGTQKLLTDATGWLTLLIPIGGGLFLAYQAFLKSMATDEAEKSAKNKLMKNVLIGVIIATSASGLVKTLLAYY